MLKRLFCILFGHSVKSEIATARIGVSLKKQAAGKKASKKKAVPAEALGEMRLKIITSYCIVVRCSVCGFTHHVPDVHPDEGCEIVSFKLDDD